jgi:hypothetical protein
MPTKDIRSNLLPKRAFLAIINSDTTTNGDIIDTADFDGGIVFNFLSTVYGAGTYTPIIEESEDSGMSGANNIADANLIGTEAGAAISAVTGASANLGSIGIFGTKRYVRVKILSASSSTTTIVATFQGATEVSPSPDLSA